MLAKIKKMKALLLTSAINLIIKINVDKVLLLQALLGSNGECVV